MEKKLADKTFLHGKSFKTENFVLPGFSIARRAVLVFCFFFKKRGLVRK